MRIIINETTQPQWTHIHIILYVIYYTMSTLKHKRSLTEEEWEKIKEERLVKWKEQQEKRARYKEMDEKRHENMWNMGRPTDTFNDINTNEIPTLDNKNGIYSQYELPPHLRDEPLSKYEYPVIAPKKTVLRRIMETINNLERKEGVEPDYYRSIAGGKSKKSKKQQRKTKAKKTHRKRTQRK